MKRWHNLRLHYHRLISLQVQDVLMYPMCNHLLKQVRYVAVTSLAMSIMVYIFMSIKVSVYVAIYCSKASVIPLTLFMLYT